MDEFAKKQLLIALGTLMLVEGRGDFEFNQHIIDAAEAIKKALHKIMSEEERNKS